MQNVSRHSLDQTFVPITAPSSQARGLTRTCRTPGQRDFTQLGTRYGWYFLRRSSTDVYWHRSLFLGVKHGNEFKPCSQLCEVLHCL